MTTLSILTCEYRNNPPGIDVPQPHLSWQMQSDRRGARQTAYQLLVAAVEARNIVRTSFHPEEYEPQKATGWDEASFRLRKVMK